MRRYPGRPRIDDEIEQSFRNIIESGDVKTLPLPARSPNLNAFAERWVTSVKNDCLSKLILFGEASFKMKEGKGVAANLKPGETQASG